MYFENRKTKEDTVLITVGINLEADSGVSLENNYKT